MSQSLPCLEAGQVVQHIFSQVRNYLSITHSPHTHCSFLQTTEPEITLQGRQIYIYLAYKEIGVTGVDKRHVLIPYLLHSETQNHEPCFQGPVICAPDSKIWTMLHSSLYGIQW
jgi:hypothetical protein